MMPIPKQYRFSVSQWIFPRPLVRFVYRNPLQRGIKEINNMTPSKPMTMPRTKWLHTMEKHIPTPRDKAPITPIKTVKIVFPEILIFYAKS